MKIRKICNYSAFNHDWCEKLTRGRYESFQTFILSWIWKKARNYFLIPCNSRKEFVKVPNEWSLVLSNCQWKYINNGHIVVNVYGNRSLVKKKSFMPYQTQQAITSSKLTIGTLEKVWNMFKVNNKDTRTRPSLWCQNEAIVLMSWLLTLNIFLKT